VSHLRQRKTPAHNTVSINSLDSSQVWSGFRVAKRARIKNRFVRFEHNKKASFGAGHDGFESQSVDCTHYREWQVMKGSIIVIDKLEGVFKFAEGYLHLHPDVKIIKLGSTNTVLATVDYIVSLEISGAEIKIENTTWHPKFGLSLVSHKLCFEFLSNIMSIKMQWCKR